MNAWHLLFCTHLMISAIVLQEQQCLFLECILRITCWIYCCPFELYTTNIFYHVYYIPIYCTAVHNCVYSFSSWTEACYIPIQLISTQYLLDYQALSLYTFRVSISYVLWLIEKVGWAYRHSVLLYYSSLPLVTYIDQYWIHIFTQSTKQQQ